MSEQNVPKLGEMPDESSRRDAVHVAICPMVAGELMECGLDVWIGDDGKAYAFRKPASKIWVGIVDPFLRREVQPGERFWLCVWPGTVTSLRHVWQHDAFKPQIPEGNR